MGTAGANHVCSLAQTERGSERGARLRQSKARRQVRLRQRRLWQERLRRSRALRQRMAPAGEGCSMRWEWEARGSGPWLGETEEQGSSGGTEGGRESEMQGE